MNSQVSGKPSVTLHIGTKKTGSTALQVYLQDHQNDLSEAGWTYPDFLENRNHFLLALLFATETSSRLNREHDLVTVEQQVIQRQKFAAMPEFEEAPVAGEGGEYERIPVLQLADGVAPEDVNWPDIGYAAASSSPTAAPASPASAEPATFPTASRTAPSSANRTVSKVNVENVVYAPQKPVPISNFGVPGRAWNSASPVMKPSSNEPVALMTRVPQGNVRSVFRCTQISIRYRIGAPIPPASATYRKFIGRHRPDNG